MSTQKENKLAPLMDINPPGHGSDMCRATTTTTASSTSNNTIHQEPPERRRRTHSEVDPESPVGPPLTEILFKKILDEALAPLHAQLLEIQEAQEKGMEETQYFHEALATVKAENKSLQNKLTTVELENSNLKVRLTYLESQSRRTNLRFHGIPESPNEDPEQLVHDALSRAGFPRCPRAIERAHRLGPKTAKIQPIIVLFSHFKDREMVWKKLGHGAIPPPYERLHVREDYPPEVEVSRAQLLPIARAAMDYKDPHTNKSPFVKLVVDKLYINHQKYTVDNIDKLPEHLRPSRIFTPMNKNRVLFFTKNSPLSNDYLSTFKCNGETYNCSEQYIMACKARLFDDQESVVKIMQEEDPVKQKRLGKNVENFDEAHWKSCAQELIVPGLLEKFKQSPVCNKILKETNQRAIFEANPSDNFFGVGMSLHASGVWTASNFPGKNIMGKVLTIVRDKLFKV